MRETGLIWLERDRSGMTSEINRSDLAGERDRSDMAERNRSYLARERDRWLERDRSGMASERQV